jgi:hypothetical protein
MQMLEYLNLVSTGGVLTTGLDLFLLNILLFLHSYIICGVRSRQGEHKHFYLFILFKLKLD